MIGGDFPQCDKLLCHALVGKARFDRQFNRMEIGRCKQVNYNMIFTKNCPLVIRTLVLPLRCIRMQYICRWVGGTIGTAENRASLW